MPREEESDFRRAAELQPRNVNIIYHLGMLCERQDRIREAMQFFNEAI
jgi:Tfp pilus assembly protein PilF